MPGGAGCPRLSETTQFRVEVVDTREDAGMTAPVPTDLVPVSAIGAVMVFSHTNP